MRSDSEFMKLLYELQSHSSLSGNDVWVIKRRDHGAAELLRNAFRDGFSRLCASVILNDCCAVFLSVSDFDRRGVLGHHNPGGATELLGGASDGLGMIPGRIGDDAGFSLGVIQATQEMIRTSKLERAGLLECFRLN